MGPASDEVPSPIHAIPGSAAASFDRICGNCSYLLVGLPGTGICPECGEPYRAEEIVLRGWAGGVHQSAATAPPRHFWWSLVGSFAWVLINFAPVNLIPWLAGMTVELKPSAHGTYRLIASRAGPGSAYRKGKRLWPINFDFECSPEQAAMLQDTLDQFRGIERTGRGEGVPSQYPQPWSPLRHLVR